MYTLVAMKESMNRPDSAKCGSKGVAFEHRLFRVRVCYFYCRTQTPHAQTHKGMRKHNKKTSARANTRAQTQTHAQTPTIRRRKRKDARKHANAQGLCSRAHTPQPSATGTHQHTNTHICMHKQMPEIPQSHKRNRVHAHILKKTHGAKNISKCKHKCAHTHTHAHTHMPLERIRCTCFVTFFRFFVELPGWNFSSWLRKVSTVTLV